MSTQGRFQPWAAGRGSRPWLCRLLLPVLLAGAPVRADALVDLRATLKRLQAADPMQAVVDFQFSRLTGEEGEPAAPQCRVAVRVEDGPLGLKVDWDRGTLQAADTEQWALPTDPLGRTPNALAMRSLTALDLAEHLNEGLTLDRLLAKSTLLEARSGTWQGRPAQLLVLGMVPVLSVPNLRRSVKEVKAQAQVWVAPDGIPLAYRAEADFKGSRYLVPFHAVQKEEDSFVRVGNRLVADRAESDDLLTGMGQKVDNHKTFRITPVAAAAR